MPTKRTFDLVVLTVILAHPVTGLFKMWATRKMADNSGSATKTVAGAVNIVT